MRFFDTAMQYLDKEKYNLAPLSVRTYFWNLKKIADFKPDLQCEDLNADVVQEYKVYLVKRGNRAVTINKALSVFRNFTNKMFQDGILKENPFDKVKIGRVYSRRGFLTKGELKRLCLNFEDRGMSLTQTEQDVMRVFLFSCFTGLRYSDLRSLDASEIFDWKIRKQMHKTGDPVYIPIPVQARLLLPTEMKAGKVFRVVENSHFNRTLRSAAQKLGYHKHIHCHLARHTFATTCITLGIPLPVTSKLLGHRNLETTLIYAKYVDAFLDKEMKKFNKL
ncbi:MULTISPECIES: site-specific integrase [unclassified Fibrobacter]|uniref:site-specific integrase n=1 Tax=unclassified Fibrobacter TaxID=2634177 RepID=UPI0025C2D088|nr:MULTISPECIES: site-specific integrase [unclassified Fibrobacter]